MFKRVTLLKNLGIQIDNLQTQPELMKGKFEFVAKENLSKHMKIQKFAGEPISFLLHKKNDFIKKLLAEKKFKNYQDHLSYQNTLKGLSQDKPVKMNKILERRLTRKLTLEKLKHLKHNHKNQENSAQSSIQNSVSTQQINNQPLSVRSMMSPSTEDNKFKIDEQYLEQVKIDEREKDQKVIEDILKNRKIIKLLPKDDELKLLEEVVQTYDEAAKLQKMAKKRENIVKLKKKQKENVKYSRNQAFNNTQIFQQTTNDTLHQRNDSPIHYLPIKEQSSCSKFNTNLMYNKLKSGQAQQFYDTFFKTAIQGSDSSLERCYYREGSVDQLNSSQDKFVTYRKDATTGRFSTKQSFFPQKFYKSKEFFKERNKTALKQRSYGESQQRFRSEDKIKVDRLIKNCHTFCKDTFKSLGQVKIERETMEERNNRFKNVSQLVKNCEGYQGIVMKNAFGHMNFDINEKIEDSKSVVKEYKSGIMDPSRIVARYEKRTIKKKKQK